jgi:hypothetical protein
MRVGSERIASVTIDTLISGRRQRLKKLMLVAAALAMMLITAAPAVAQVGQESEQEGESGEVDQSFTVSGSGGSANPTSARPSWEAPRAATRRTRPTFTRIPRPPTTSSSRRAAPT